MVKNGGFSQPVDMYAHILLVLVCVCAHVYVRAYGAKANGERKKMEKRKEAALIGTWSWSWGALTHPMPWMDWNVGTCQNVCLVLPWPGIVALLHTSMHIYAMQHHHCDAVHSCANGSRDCKGRGRYQYLLVVTLLRAVLP